jgi:O-antigen/teichoic acid export membrane protein
MTLKDIWTSSNTRPAPSARRMDGAGSAWVADTRRSDQRADLSTLARGGMLSLAGSIFGSIFAFLLVVVITRGLHSQGAGLLFEAIALFTILSNVGELGADTGLVRMVSRNQALDQTQKLRTMITLAIWPVVIVGALFGIAVYVFAPQLSHVFMHGPHPEDGIIYIRLLAPFLPLAAATTVALAGTRGFGTMVPYVAVLNIGVPGLRPILVLVAIAGGLGSTAIALAYAVPVGVGFIVAVVVLMALLRREERRKAHKPKVAISARALASEFWRFSAPRGLAGTMMIALVWLNILLLGALRSTREAGVYAAASRYVGLGSFALAGLAMAIAPQISSLLAKKEQHRASSLYHAGTSWLMVPSWPAYVTVAVYAPLFMRVFGRDFASGQTALIILTLGSLSVIATGNNKIVLLMGGGSTLNLVSSGMALALNVGLNLLLIPRYGINGAAIAYASSLVLDNVVTTTAVWVKLRLHPFGSGYPIVLVAASVLYGGLGLAFRAYLGATVKSFALFALVATSLYVGVLWTFRRRLNLRVLGAALRYRGQRVL